MEKLSLIPATDSEPEEGSVAHEDLFGNETESVDEFPLSQVPVSHVVDSVEHAQPEQATENRDKRSRLKRLLLEQRKRLPQVSQEPVPIFRSKRRRALPNSEPHSLSKEEAWRKMVDRMLILDGTFFDSPEARLEVNEAKKRGKVVYSGLNVFSSNCYDIETIYDMRYRSRVLFTKKKSQPFECLRSTAGQFLRFLISLGLLDRKDGYKEKALFGSLADYDAVEYFMNHFNLTSSPYTVASKCTHLTTIISVAQIVLHNDADVAAKLKFNAEYLRNLAASSKRAARQKRRQQRLMEISLDNQNLLLDEDMRKAYSIARHKLRGIVETYRLDEAEKDGSFLSRLESNGDLVHKWCLNFLAAVVFSCGGQRPKAIASLQVPSRRELNRVETTPIGNFLSLRSNLDKRERNLNYPVVTFPASMKQFLEFHTNIIRPYMKKKLKFVDKEGDARLLVHSRDGVPFRSRNVTTSIRTFMTNIDRKFKFVTTMTVRGSYATSMMHSFRLGKVGKDVSQAKFMDALASRMNTSPEQLTDAYIQIVRTDYESAVQLAMEHFVITMEENDDDDDDDDDNERKCAKK